jgi:hypothetical protein
MPNLGDGQQIKVWFPEHILDALWQDAKDSGERHVQPLVRYIIGKHYQEQANGVGLVVDEGGSNG